jgi:ABC-type uncharacterized transport system auxiliary subunit
MFFANNLRLYLGLGTLIAALGCGGAKIPPTHYYTLNLAAPAPSSDRLGFTAIVMPFQATQVIKRDRIVYRESREEVGFYDYHRWAEDPREQVADSFVKQLLARGSFSSLTSFDGRTKSDYVLRGSIKRLEEVDYDSPISVAVEISLELVNSESAKVVWSDVATKTGPVTSGDVRSVVSGLSQAADQSISELAGKLDSYLRSIS